MKKNSRETQIRMRKDETKRLKGGQVKRLKGDKVKSLKPRPDNETLPFKQSLELIDGVEKNIIDVNREEQ